MVIFLKKKIIKKNAKAIIKMPYSKIESEPIKSKKILVKKKVVKKQDYKIEHASTKVGRKSTQPTKNINLIELKPRLEKLHVRHSSLSKSQKWLIGILIAFVIIIIVIAFLIPKNVYEPTNDTNTIIDNLISDNNIITNPNGVMTIEQFQNASLALQRSVYKDIMIEQKTILEKYYYSLGLDAQKMNSCISKNDFTRSDVNVENSKILMKIQKDTYLAPVVGVNEAPGIFVNGYYLSGSVSYSSMKTIIDYALTDKPISWDYSVKTYESDSSAKATVTVIYNEDHPLIKDNTVDFIASLKTSEALTPEVKNFFVSLFSEASTNYYNYTSTKGKEVIQTLDIQVIPVIYLEGDINKLTITKDKNFAEMFNYLFIKTDVGDIF